MKSCPRCGSAIEQLSRRCSQCGIDVIDPVWPPSVQGNLPPILVVQPLKTGAVWGDIAFGIVSTIALFAFFGLGILLIPVVYSFESKDHPVFAKAIAWSYLGVLAGLFALFYLTEAMGFGLH